MKKLIYLLLLVMTLVSCQQETIPQDTGRSSVPPLFSFTLTETGAILTAYNGRETAVIIPESWEGLPVTAIEGAFTGNTTLTAVEIPDSVTMIGDHSFSGCTALREINFPDGLKKIGDGAFNGCASLDEIHLPDSVTALGERAFANCESCTEFTLPAALISLGEGAFAGENRITALHIPAGLTQLNSSNFPKGLCELTIDLDNPVYTVIDGFLIEKDSGTLVGYTGGKQTEQAAIPSMVTAIGEYALKYAVNIRELIIPETVMSIAFRGCAGMERLEKVTILSDDIDIDSYAFYSGALSIKNGEISLLNEAEYSFALHAREDSAGQQFARENEISFVVLSD